MKEIFICEKDSPLSFMVPEAVARGAIVVESTFDMREAQRHGVPVPGEDFLVYGEKVEYCLAGTVATLLNCGANSVAVDISRSRSKEERSFRELDDKKRAELMRSWLGWIIWKENPRFRFVSQESGSEI